VKKKITIMTLLAMLLLSISVSSAFASGNVKKTSSPSNPNVFYGVGDFFTGTLSSYSDIDYFRWHNDTGNDKTYFLYLFNLDNPELDYQI